MSSLITGEGNPPTDSGKDNLPTGTRKDNPLTCIEERNLSTDIRKVDLAIGIDLGTWKCCVGVVRDGKVEIIKNERGSKTTPSYVAFTETERLVGEDAKLQVVKNWANTVFGVKRIIGRMSDDPSLKNDIDTVFPFTVRTDEEKPVIEVNYRNKEIQLFSEQVSAMLLTKMKRIAESHLGCEVKDAVISVPAYFNNAQRQATKDAGAIAGLNVLGLINEPTAAALAYRDNKGPSDETICLVDLGGGTLDVSIIKMEGEKGVTVVKTSGDTALGGMDFDQGLVKHFMNEFHEKHKEDLSRHKNTIPRLRLTCEKVKHTLSLLRSDDIEIGSLTNGKYFASSISREKFNALLLESFDPVLNSVISRTQMNVVDRIVLIGGSTRVPVIVEKLGRLHKKLDRSVNPDEAVAHGAAIYAADLRDGRRSVRDVYAHKICYKTGEGTKETLVSPLTPVPLEKVVLLKGNKSSSLKLQVFEKFFNHKTGNYQKCSVEELRFGTVDDSYGLEVVCKLSWDGIYSTEVKFPVLQNQSVESMTVQEEEFQSDEVDEKKRQIVINELEAYISSKKSVINEVNAAVGDQQEFLKLCNDTIAFLESNPTVSEEECNKKYCALKNLFEHLSKLVHSETSIVRPQTLAGLKEVSDFGENENVQKARPRNDERDDVNSASGLLNETVGPAVNDYSKIKNTKQSKQVNKKENKEVKLDILRPLVDRSRFGSQVNLDMTETIQSDQKQSGTTKYKRRSEMVKPTEPSIERSKNMLNEAEGPAANDYSKMKENKKYKKDNKRDNKKEINDDKLVVRSRFGSQPNLDMTDEIQSDQNQSGTTKPSIYRSKSISELSHPVENKNEKAVSTSEVRNSSDKDINEYKQSEGKKVELNRNVDTAPLSAKISDKSDPIKENKRDKKKENREGKLDIPRPLVDTPRYVSQPNLDMTNEIQSDQKQSGTTKYEKRSEMVKPTELSIEKSRSVSERSRQFENKNEKTVSTSEVRNFSDKDINAYKQSEVKKVENVELNHNVDTAPLSAKISDKSDPNSTAIAGQGAQTGQTYSSTSSMANTSRPLVPGAAAKRLGLTNANKGTYSANTPAASRTGNDDQTHTKKKKTVLKRFVHKINKTRRGKTEKEKTKNTNSNGASHQSSNRVLDTAAGGQEEMEGEASRRGQDRGDGADERGNGAEGQAIKDDSKMKGGKKDNKKNNRKGNENDNKKGLIKDKNVEGNNLEKSTGETVPP